MKIELKCINCGNGFMCEFKHRNKKFCNRKCYFEYTKKHKINGRKKDLSIREKFGYLFKAPGWSHDGSRLTSEQLLAKEEYKLLFPVKEEKGIMTAK